MFSDEQLREKISEKLPGASVSDYVSGEFTAMVFRDRDYPDGDDICRMFLRCVATFNLKYSFQDLFCVLTQSGQIYSIVPITESAGTIYSKRADFIAELTSQ